MSHCERKGGTWRGWIVPVGGSTPDRLKWIVPVGGLTPDRLKFNPRPAPGPSGMGWFGSGARAAEGRRKGDGGLGLEDAAEDAGVYCRVASRWTTVIVAYRIVQCAAQ